MKLVGVDTGGTFTDLVLCDDDGIRTHKLLSTPAAPERAVIAGIRALGIKDTEAFAMMHGSTVGTNAVLEGKGVKTVYVTNRGFADALTIARQARSEIYKLKPTPGPCPVPAELCFETGGRIAADGAVLEDLGEDDIAALQEQIARHAPMAVAVNLLFSFVDARFEKALEEALSADYFVSRSSRVHPAPGEYERGIATWLNAYIGPLMRAYLKKLCSGLPGASVRVMQSHGSTIAAGSAGDYAVNLLLSGPAGGVMAVAHLAQAAGERRVLGFDMGGTSTDVSVLNGGVSLTTDGRFGPYPVSVPMVDVHTIGAGGGSIACVDQGGLLQVGPESAGASPGPACYGRGGLHPTVTDANLLLGRLPSSLHGLNLDRAAAERAFAPLARAQDCSAAEAARGVIEIVNEQMTQALRTMSVHKTFDPADFLLLGFGAAGGLHVCALAERMRMKRAVVPAHAGVLSALGMLVAPQGLQKTRAVCRPLEQVDAALIDAVYDELAADAGAAMRAQGVPSFDTARFAELRYRGQSTCLTLPAEHPTRLAGAFHAAHETRYGHRLDLPVELAALRLHAWRDTEMDPAAALKSAHDAGAPPQAAGFTPSADGRIPVYHRQALSTTRPVQGPAVIIENTATTYLAENWSARLDQYGSLCLLHETAQVQEPMGMSEG